MQPNMDEYYRALAEFEKRKRTWRPLHGPQTEAFNSPADILFYGGAAGGGKTDLILGVALKHQRAVIFRRVFPSMEAIIERSRAIYGVESGTYNESSHKWRFEDGKQVIFGSLQHEKDKADWQGKAHDLYCFDEITEFTESQFRFVTGWNRPLDTGKASRCRVIVTGNPPCSAEGDWVIEYFRPWLDDKHPNPAQPGELRWFTTQGGKDIELPDGSPVMIDGELVVPRSRTFIPAKVQDNPHLMKSGYLAQLQALPEPLRSKMLYGDFRKGREDDPYQVIPSEWVKLAQERWVNSTKPDLPMTAVGLDVARGGSDKTVISVRYGRWMDFQHAYPGKQTPDGPVVATLALQHRKDNATINVDVIGVGTSVYDHLKDTVEVVPINGAEKSEATDASGQLGFVNLRAEIYWKLREALDPASGQDICLPPDRELMIDLCAPTWKMTPRGIQVESKEDLIKRIGRSPDKGDSCVYCFAIKHVPGMGFFEFLKSQAAKAPSCTAS